MKRLLNYLFLSFYLCISSLFSQTNMKINYLENQWRLKIEDNSFFELDTLVFYEDYYQDEKNRSNTVLRIEKFFPSNWGSKLYNFQRVIVFFVKNNYINKDKIDNLPIKGKWKIIKKDEIYYLKISRLKPIIPEMKSISGFKKNISFKIEYIDKSKLVLIQCLENN